MQEIKSGGHNMDQILDYIKPELLIVAVVLYFIGIGLKRRMLYRISTSRSFLVLRESLYVRYG